MRTMEMTIGAQKQVVNKPRRKVRTIWKLVALYLAIWCMFSVIDANIEIISDTAAKKLMLDVEAGNELAIKKFDKYIERDIYLFNGPITIKAMADKYDIDYDTLYKDFVSSDYVSLQKYFNDVVESNISKR